MGLRSDMLRDAKDRGLFAQDGYGWIASEGLPDVAYIAIVVAPGRGIDIGKKEKREVIQMRGTG